MADQDLSKLRIDKSSFARRRKRKNWVFLLISSVAVLLGTGFLYTQGALTPALEVQLATVTTVYPSQTLTLLNASGYVVAQRKAAVGSKLTSRLVYLGVEEGDRVQQGDVIARLENADLLAARDRARASIEVARTALSEAAAELRDATSSYQRAQELLSRKFVAQSEFDAAEARYKRALAAVANQKATLQLGEAILAEAEVQLGYSEIRAPFAAVVLTKNADIGDIITPLGAAANARASVVTIADMGSYQVEADVAEVNIAQVQPGQPCEIQLDALPDSRLRGRVHMIVPTADRSKASVLVKVAFIDNDPRILPEMSAKVAFLSRDITPEEKQPFTAVPVTAIVEHEGHASVYVVRDNHAVVTAVSLGRRYAGLTEVNSGLRVGERVILQPQNEIKNGVRVRSLEG
jgi:RND family efflux transporter MFP subunit